MLGDEAGDQRVPQRAYRIVVAPVTATGLQQLHQRFVGEGVEHQLQALEITQLVDAVPAKREGPGIVANGGSPVVNGDSPAMVAASRRAVNYFIDK